MDTHTFFIRCGTARNQTTSASIKAFRKELTSQKKITQGKHFNLQHLIAAYQAYDKNFDTLGNYRDLFWRQVIGYVQRQISAYDAQIYCSGIQNVLENEKLFSRSLSFYNGVKFFPLLINSGLGFDFAIVSYYLQRGTSERGPMVAAGHSRVLKNYLEQKQMHLLDLESYLSKECITSPANRS